MADVKMGSVGTMPIADVLSTDYVWFLDRSATTGANAGPNGTWKLLPVSFFTENFTPKGKIAPKALSLEGIDTSQPELTYIAEAINTTGPHTCDADERMSFYTVYSVGESVSTVTIRKRYYRLHQNLTSVGTGDNQVTEAQISPAGEMIINPQIIELGDIGAGPVHTVFNQGNPDDSDNPWVVSGETFVTAILNDVFTIWEFVGGDGLWKDPTNQISDAGDFLIQEQDPTVSTYRKTVNFLSLSGIDTTQPELKYIRDAVIAKGPFTCAADQSMIFYTSVIIGDSQENYGVLLRYYEYIRRGTSVGGTAVDVELLDTDFIPHGSIQPKLVSETDFIDLGTIADIEATPVEDVFNEGEDLGGGAYGPWTVAGITFVKAIVDGVKTVWLFTGADGDYGGDDLGSDPDILEATEAMFTDLADQGDVDITTLMASQVYTNLKAKIIPREKNKQNLEAFGVGLSKLLQWWFNDQLGLDIDFDVDYAWNDTQTEMIAAQGDQTTDKCYFVLNAGGDPKIWRYLGTTDGDIGDYEEVVYSGGGSYPTPTAETGTAFNFRFGGTYLNHATPSTATTFTEGTVETWGSCNCRINTTGNTEWADYSFPGTWNIIGQDDFEEAVFDVLAYDKNGTIEYFIVKAEV